MKISECMNKDVRIADPNQTLESAAQVMAEIDAGFLPIGENDRLVGIVTDRDIAVRGVAKGLPPDTPLRSVMSQEVDYCYEDDETEDVLGNLGNLQLRRLPVLNREKRLTGIVSLSDLSHNAETVWAGEALSDITQPSTLHSQAI